jgi:hypothetical protein
MAAMLAAFASRAELILMLVWSMIAVAMFVPTLMAMIVRPQWWAVPGGLVILSSWNPLSKPRYFRRDDSILFDFEDSLYVVGRDGRSSARISVARSASEQTFRAWRASAEPVHLRHIEEWFGRPVRGVGR